MKFFSVKNSTRRSQITDLKYPLVLIPGNKSDFQPCPVSNEAGSSCLFTFRDRENPFSLGIRVPFHIKIFRSKKRKT
jgi:hypothetical protein